jgi:uncharacterized membrane protein
MNIMTQNRYRSPVLWAAVAAQIISVIGLVGGWDAIGVSDSVVKGVVTAVLEILTLVGILNDPTNKVGW